MSRSDRRGNDTGGTGANPRGGLAQAVVSIIAGYAGKAHHLPIQYHLLIIFGCIFVLLMLVGDRDPRSVAIMSATVLAAYLVVFLLNERKENRELAQWRGAAEQLRRFLGLGSSDRHAEVRFQVPCVEARHHPLEDLSYQVNSLALDDVRAVIEIVSLLVEFRIVRDSQTINPSRLFIKKDVVPEFRAGALFLVGGPLPNRFVRRMIADSPHIAFEDWGEEIGIVLKDDPGRKFTMKPPRGTRSIEDALLEATYGCVMKTVENQVTRFAIWGLDARGTVGAAHWLTSNWSGLKQEFDIGLDQPFTAVLRLGAEEFLHAQRPRCEPGQPLLLPEP